MNLSNVITGRQFVAEVNAVNKLFSEDLQTVRQLRRQAGVMAEETSTTSKSSLFSLLQERLVPHIKETFSLKQTSRMGGESLVFIGGNIFNIGKARVEGITAELHLKGIECQGLKKPSLFKLLQTDSDEAIAGDVLILIGGKIYNFKTASESLLKQEIQSLHIDCRGMGRLEMFLFLHGSDLDPLDDSSDEIQLSDACEKKQELKKILLKAVEYLEDVYESPSDIALNAMSELLEFFKQ